MRDEKQALLQLLDKQENCEFCLKFIIQKSNSSWRNLLTILMLVKKGTENETKYDYDEFILVKKLLTIEEGCHIISSLLSKTNEKGKLSIPGYAEFFLESSPVANFLRSRQAHHLVRSLWPTRYLECRVQQDQVCQDWSRELFDEKLPYYPNLNEAAMSFLDLKIENFGLHGYVYVIIPDYRARMEFMKLAFSKIDLKLHSPELPLSDLIIKVFAKSKQNRVVLPDKNPNSENVTFDVGFQPEYLEAVLISKQDNIKIDGKEFAAWRSEAEGIFLERPDEEIMSLLKAGESQNLEYKLDVVDEKGRNDLVETVIAFLNTNKGSIVVGVSDDGTIVGTHTNAESLRKMIHDCCDPPPTGLRVEERTIEDKKIIIIDVAEGNDKPYQSKRDKNLYVRHNGTDMRMERSELMRLIDQMRTGTWQNV
jgi:hypothetical protein